jgi:hypothetical protein
MAEWEQVRRLIAAGLNDCEIERIAGIPRRTICDWRRGKGGGAAREAAGACAHDPERLPHASYAYLLGAYLGDGYIVHNRRGVYRLRVTCNLLYANIVSWIARPIEEVRGRPPALQLRTEPRTVDVSSLHEYVRYEFSNRSDDIKRIFRDALGVEWRVMNADAISVARRASVAKLDAFIGRKR